MGGIFGNLRFGFRMLLGKPGFTLVALLTLSLGIGGNIAMFSVVDGVLLRPLPFPDSNRLVQIRTQWSDFGYGSMNPSEYLDIQQRSNSFEKIGIYRWASVNFQDGQGDVEQIDAMRVSGSLFEVLQVQPALGRLIHPEETYVGRASVALLSDGLWKRRFGGDAGVLGTTLRILNNSYEVVGVMPPDFDFPNPDVDLWVSYRIDLENLGNRGAHSSSVLARLAPGVTLDQAQADIEVLSAQLREEFPVNYPEASRFHFAALSYPETITGEIRPALLTLLGAVGFVLLIACANLTNLLLVRIKSREKELAIRAALGAGQRRIFGQILSESFLLCLLGGIGAIVVAWAAVQGLITFFPDSVPRLDEVRLDGRVWGFSVALVAFVAVAIGLFPAWRITRNGGLQQRLREGGRDGQADGHSRTRGALVVAEVALATVLLVAAGLLVRSFQELLAVDPGFQPERVLTTQLTLPSTDYRNQESRVLFYENLLQEMSAQPGILAASLVNIPPMSGFDSDYSITGEGYEPPNPEIPDFIQYRTVSPDYFETFGIPVLEGRSFGSQDRTGAQPVAIISSSLAEKYWPGEAAVGKRIRPGGPNSQAPWHSVVGVVGDIYHRGARAGEVPIWYRSVFQDNWSSTTMAVRTHSEPGRAESLIREAVGAVDPQIPIYDTREATEFVSASLAQERFNTTLLGLFAGLALALAGIGIFGVISYSVTQRTREIGVRMAMGARPAQVLRQMLREGVWLIGSGLLLGILGALFVSGLLSRFLFGITAWDPITYLAIVGILLLTGLLACWGPAARATRVDPLIALRAE